MILLDIEKKFDRIAYIGLLRIFRTEDKSCNSGLFEKRPSKHVITESVILQLKLILLKNFNTNHPNV